MSGQLDLEYVLEARSNAGWLRLPRAIRTGAAALGHSVLVERTEIQASILSEALADRGKRHIQARWLVTLLTEAPETEAERAALTGVLTALAGYDIAPRKTLTPEEKLAALEEAVKDEFGQAGMRLLTRVRR